MYAAIAKNGEPINGIKAGILGHASVSQVSISQRDDDDEDRVATQINNFTMMLKAFAISGVHQHVSSPNRARANGHERVAN